jgi:hypothetical protein
MTTKLQNRIRADSKKNRLFTRLQGITSDLDDLFLRGDSMKAIIGDALIEGTLERTIAGASTLNLSILDPNRHLLQSPLLLERHRVTLDGINFLFTKVSQQSSEAPLTLVYEPEVVALIRAVKGPRKAFRDKVTRAEFVLRIIRAAQGPPIRFVCPQLETIQPIKSAVQAHETRSDANLRRGKGLDGDSHLPEKEGGEASPAQRKLGDLALRIAESHKAPTRVMVALMEALLVESNLGELSSNILQGLPGTPLAGLDHVEQIVGFLTGKNWTTEKGGALGNFARHPNAKPYEIAQDVQASGAGLSSHGRANYGAVESEALEWVESFGGGEIEGGGEGPTRFQRYAFEQKAKEDGWACGSRLGKEVNWRFFESAGWVYFIAESDLLRSMRRMTISDSTPGVLDTSFDYDLGKEVQTVTVSALAKSWAAPPGSRAWVNNHGPADGSYIVSTISAPLAKRDSVVTITLKRPTEPLPEPAPKAVKSSTGRPKAGASKFGADGNAPRPVEAMISMIEAFDKANNPYDWGGGHGSTFASPSTPCDCSGFVSSVLHAGGYLSTPEASPALMSFGDSGPGEWVTIYSNVEHVFGVIRTASGWRTFQAGGSQGSNPGGGGWSSGRSHSGFVTRHPHGL